MTLPSGDTNRPRWAHRGDVQRTAPTSVSSVRGDVMVYYYPQWHADPVNAELHGREWTEWELIRRARPRFDGHSQPKVPLWGEVDESDPAVASRAVAAALDHGIRGFIVDWYWYEDGPFLNRALDEGLLHADRLDEFTFALMWANHDWTKLFPAEHPEPGVLLPAPNGYRPALRAFAHVIEKYLSHPSYYRVDGKAYFSIYDIPGFVRGQGSIAEAAALLEAFRTAARAAGAGELHLNAVTTRAVPEATSVIPALGFDSVTHYTWWHHQESGFDTFPAADYARIQRLAVDEWSRSTDAFSIPYLPNVTMGWDPSPRTVEWAMNGEEGYPFTSIAVNNTPERFGEAVRLGLEHAMASPGPAIVTVNAWNEWTEGSYLEPDVASGYAYLEALRDGRARALAADAVPPAIP